MLDDAANIDPRDLVAHLADEDTSIDDKVRALIDGAVKLIDNKPDGAWSRISQASRLLGDKNLPNGVFDTALRLETSDRLVKIASRLLIDGIPLPYKRDEVLAEAIRCLNTEDSGYGKTSIDTLTQLEAWAADTTRPPFAFLGVAAALDESPKWLSEALLSVRQSLQNAIEAGAADIKHSAEFLGDVEGWLRIAQAADTQIASKAKAFREAAIDAIIKTDPPNPELLLKCEAIITKWLPDDLSRMGGLKARQGKYIEAAGLLERAGEKEDAFTCWREAGRWEEALRLAEEGVFSLDKSILSNLKWLAAYEAVVKSRPEKHSAGITAAETKRFEQLVESLRGKQPPPKRLK